MTRHKDFKAVVRARMLETGETYTAARAALADAAQKRRDEAKREQQLIIARWFIGGRLKSIPAKRKVRAAVLLEVMAKFVPGRVYPEPEVSHLLELIHEDFAYLRRELVSFGYLERQAGSYQVCRIPPCRSERERRELPIWEEIWLPGFVARTSSISAREEAARCPSH